MKHIAAEEKQSVFHFNVDITTFVRVELDTSWRCANASTPFNRIYAVLDGEGEISVNRETTVMKKGGVYLVPAGSHFSYKCDDHLTKIYVHFNLIGPDGSDILLGLKNSVSLEDCPYLTDKIEEIFRSDEPSMTLKLNALILKIVSSQANMLSKPVVHSRLVKEAIDYIGLHYAEHPDESALAKAMSVSAQTLRKAFRKEMDVSLIRYVNDRIMIAAERELRTTSLPVNEISAKLGYADPLYFSRVFAARYGVSPRNYRKRIKS